MTVPDPTVRAAAERRFDSKLSTWAQGDTTGLPASVSIPGLTSADFAAAREETVELARAWKSWTGPGSVQTSRIRWGEAGMQDVPARLTFGRPADLASFLGRDKQWMTAVSRIEDLRADWPAFTRLTAGVFTEVTSVSEDDWTTLLGVLSWADENDVTGVLARQLPVPGADTKWVERRWHLVVKLTAAGCRTNPVPLGELRKIGELMFCRILDPALREQSAGLGLLMAPPADLARMPLTPARVIVCENLQNGYAFTDLPGTVVLAGKGYDVTDFANIPWVASASELIYWGDIDTHGFSILNRFRAHLPTRSMLMDETTLLRNKHVWATETAAITSTLANLTDYEQTVYQNLIAGAYGRPKVRMEQERVPWADVLVALG